MKPTGRLENWVKDKHHNVLWGNIYGDERKRFRDGTWIHTSLLETEPPYFEGRIVATLNSFYRLGKPGFSIKD